MPTIYDVAKLSGVSKTTVSRVINNHSYVSKENKELVTKAMKEAKPFCKKVKGESNDYNRCDCTKNYKSIFLLFSGFN